MQASPVLPPSLPHCLWSAGSEAREGFRRECKKGVSVKELLYKDRVDWAVRVDMNLLKEGGEC